jgi:hypothetical protein
LLKYGCETLSEEVSKKLDRETQEAWDYLLEVVGDYRRYLADIGELGLNAPNLLYYRSEVQDMLDDFKTDKRVDFRGIWTEVKELDEILRRKQQQVVNEIGHANFKQYQIINDPPRAHWWWWLNRVTHAPPPPPPWWAFWKKPADEEVKEPGATPEAAAPPPESNTGNTPPNQSQ